MSRSLSLLIKPSGADCNLDCRYCFYLNRPELHSGEARTRMSDEVLEALIRNFMAIEQPVHAFCWQGGEPTLMGVSFFERVVELQQRFGRPGAVVANGIQTNGVLIDDDLAAHFARYRFLAGCSIDGPADAHDRHRVTAVGEATHAAVQRGIERLDAAGVPIDALVVVTQANVARAREVYEGLVAEGRFHHHYIPCLERDAEGVLQPYAIDGEAWGRFLGEIFAIWSDRDVGRVSVRLFESTVAKLLIGRAALCTQNDCCDESLVVEYDGGVYPCDFFVRSDLRLGDVRSDSLDDLRRSAAYGEFGSAKSRLPRVCRDCPHLDLCGGDCPRNRGPDGGPSLLCSGWFTFFEASRARFEDLAAGVRARGYSG